ncbi:dihydrofolate reductase [Arthrobacter sp. yr096]|uniref:dihydrofolate reductase n=1 Tax=unclassified Arthrobacter TaxID=235627 RepID=UPI000894988D|nr:MULTISPECIES: dihydrofolate reductase [unclassified Arthrobacter]SDX20854.1 dihydrofolate reductase [Arthrobacter sp. cf158]SEI46293.1 dihydrofolate reductase [Arthrobacter sp. yr096]
MSTSSSDIPAQLPSVIFTQETAATMTGIGMIWAQTTSGVIGKDGSMPWHLPEDLKHFSQLTTGHPVIMGRKTWESFPEKYRPLPGRTNIVVTRNAEWASTPEAEGALVVSSLDDALLESQFAPGGHKVWIIGGAEIFEQSMGIANLAVITIIDADCEGDTFAPELGDDWTFDTMAPAEGWLTAKNGTNFRFTTWRRKES